MIELLCISDLHLGENYSFLDYSNWDWEQNQEILQPFYRGIAKLDGLTSKDNPEVHVGTLVLLGDIFELATATIERAGKSGRNFFDWLFQWLHPSKVIYIPGNHDHVFWMWWCIPPDDSGQNWWEMNPKQAKGPLVEKYGDRMEKACDPWQPEGVNGNAWREELIYHFFGCLVEPSTFYLAYPAYVGPPCGPPGFRDRPFRTLFTHGHLNDPTFVRPKDSGFVGWAMHLKMKEWGNPADMSNLNTAEKSTWKYTNEYWYPPTTNTTRGEQLYLCSTMFERNNPCRHPFIYQRRYVKEPAPDLKRVDVSSNDFYNFLLAALGENWYLSPYLYVYGHTHHGGAMSLAPGLHLYNTGGWLDIVKDNPIHTHLFAITSDGISKMVRVDFSRI
ncbi:MAG: hypothetical protein BBJ57_02600 [Desulfobacterales bacterium PC51MH44]|nr:MAG: hypothetical protein BBJ57_02600 [Desulfobacterales bacterium PC51MH44]